MRSTLGRTRWRSVDNLLSDLGPCAQRGGWLATERAATTTTKRSHSPLMMSVLVATTLQQYMLSCTATGATRPVPGTRVPLGPTLNAGRGTVTP